MTWVSKLVLFSSFVHRQPKKSSSGVRTTRAKEDKSEDKYEGLTPTNALDELKDVKGDQRRKAILEYIDIHIKEISGTDAWVKTDKKLMEQILKSDNLSMSEGDVLEALVKWGQREAKEKKLGDDAEALRKALTGLLELIRFPAMPSEEIATKVIPTGILTQEQTLDLFTVIGAADPSKAKLPKSLSMYNQKPRVARRKPTTWRWSAEKKNPTIVLTQDGFAAECTDTAAFKVVLGDTELKSGIHEWEIVLDRVYTQANAIVIGIVPASYSSYAASQILGYPGHGPGWGFALRSSRKYNGSRTPYGKRCGNAGENIRVTLDLDKGNLSFSINGVPQGNFFLVLRVLFYLQ